MIILVTSVHIIVCIGLIIVVLLQTGKGADMGAAFGGGSSSTVFGSSGAGNFLTRLTTGMAVVFMLTSLTLGYFAGQRPSSSVFDRVDPSAASSPSTPSMPEQRPAQQATGAAEQPAQPAAQ